MSSLLNRLAPAFADLASKNGFKDKTVVDLGCGFGRWGHMIRSQVDEGGNEAYIIGCDIFRQYLTEVKKHNPYDELVVCDASRLPFQSKSVDIAITFEMIEHMPKDMGLKFLSRLTDICRERIVVSTPMGFMQQDEIRGNEHEEHKSAWNVGDLQKMGFNVQMYGLGIGIENVTRRLRINSALSRGLQLVFLKGWAGIQLGAEKTIARDNRTK